MPALSKVASALGKKSADFVRQDCIEFGRHRGKVVAPSRGLVFVVCWSVARTPCNSCSCCDDVIGRWSRDVTSGDDDVKRHSMTQTQTMT